MPDAFQTRDNGPVTRTTGTALIRDLDRSGIRPTRAWLTPIPIRQPWRPTAGKQGANRGEARCCGSQPGNCQENRDTRAAAIESSTAAASTAASIGMVNLVTMVLRVLRMNVVAARLHALVSRRNSPGS